MQGHEKPSDKPRLDKMQKKERQVRIALLPSIFLTAKD
jgi:hypothetical protein